MAGGLATVESMQATTQLGELLADILVLRRNVGHVLMVLRLQLEDGVDELLGALPLQLVSRQRLMHHGRGRHREHRHSGCIG